MSFKLKLKESLYFTFHTDGKEKIAVYNSIIGRAIIYLTLTVTILAFFTGIIVYNVQVSHLEEQFLHTGYSFLHSFIEQSQNSIAKGQRKSFQDEMDNMAKIDEVVEAALFSPYGLMTFKSGEVSVGIPFVMDPDTDEFVNPNIPYYNETDGRARREDWYICDRIDTPETQEHLEEMKDEGPCSKCHIAIIEENLHFNSDRKAHFIKTDRVDFYYDVPATGDCIVCHTNWKVDQSAGFLKISVDRELFNLQKRETFWGITSIIFAIIIPAAIVMIVVFRYLLHRPLYSFISNFDDLTHGEGDLSQRLDVCRADEVGKLSLIFNEFVDKLSRIISEIRDQIFVLDISTSEITTVIQEQSATAAEQSASVIEVTSTMEELSLSSNNISRNSAELVSNASKSLQEADEGLIAMRHFVNQMNMITRQNTTMLKEIDELQKKSNEISIIMELINRISDQTKLISFNAALEAASSGEAGKRFNLIALEIRRLADSVTDSTFEISEKIDEIQHTIKRINLTSERHSGMIEESKKSSLEIVQMMSRSQKMAQKTEMTSKSISISTQEQQTANEQIVIALKEISQGTQDSTQSIKMVEKAIRNILELSKELKAQINNFTLPEKSDPNEC